MRFVGLAMIAAGAAGWWYNEHLAATAGHFYIKLCVFAPLGVFGGMLVLLRPDWAGPLRSDSSRGHKAALATVIGLMAIASGLEMYRLKSNGPPAPPLATTPWSRTPVVAAANVAAPSIAFLNRTYHLGSFNQKQNPMWEFVPANESVNNWTTLLTIVDRPDARTREDLDRLAEGIMSAYKSRGAKILLARTMQESRTPFNYMVAAFEEADKQRYELSFVKIALGANHASIAIYGVRVADPVDYRAKAKEFLDGKSSEVGRALGALVLPDIATLPR